jgi:hypothetical protein
MECKLAVAHQLAQEVSSDELRGNAALQEAVWQKYQPQVKTTVDVNRNGEKTLGIFVFGDNSSIIASYLVGSIIVIEPCPDSALRDVQSYIDYLRADPKLASSMDVMFDGVTVIEH